LITEFSEFCGRMFSTDMIENKNREWKINDFDENVVEEFLEFAYTGNTRTLELGNDINILMELFRISHKYDVAPLEYQCEGLLLSRMNVEDVVNIYYLGFVYQSKTIKAAAKTEFDK
jgi:hypothetical protein